MFCFLPTVPAYIPFLTSCPSLSIFLSPSLPSPEQSASQCGLSCCTSRKWQASSLLAEASYWMSAALSQLYASSHPARHVRDLPPAPCAVGLCAGSCCGAADFKQCVSVAGGEQLPAGFPEQMSWLVRASFSDKICTVWRTSRQLVNLSKLMEKHDPCTS